MTILSKVDSKADSNILAICDNIINKTYAIGITDDLAYSIHKKPVRHKLTKKGFNRISHKIPIIEKSISFKRLINILESKYKFLETPLLKKNNETLKSVLDIIAKELSGIITFEIAEQMVKNTLKASVINPINRKEYGNNAESTIKIKGFDKPIVDTGQIINNIEAWRIE